MDIYELLGGAVKQGLKLTSNLSSSAASQSATTADGAGGGTTTTSTSGPTGGGGLPTQHQHHHDVKLWGEYGGFTLSLRCVISSSGDPTGQLVADIFPSPTSSPTPPGPSGVGGGGVGRGGSSGGAILSTLLVRSKTESSAVLGGSNLSGGGGRGGGGGVLPVPCKFRWRRKLSRGVFVEIANASSNVHQLSADDIATFILVEATPDKAEAADAGCWGTAYGEIGPFDVDVRSRQILENGFANGSLRFPVKLVEDTRDGRSGMGGVEETNKQLVIHIMTEEVKVLQPGPMNMGYTRKWCAKYGAEYPIISLHNTNAMLFTVSFGTGESVSLEAFSRHQRDLIALGVRCFHARSYVSTSALLDLVLPSPDYRSGRALESAEGNGQIDLFCLVEKLRAELNRTVEIADRCLREREKAMVEKESLQAEMTDTIEAFQTQLGDAQPDGNPAYATYKTMIEEKYAENEKLQATLMSTTRELQHKDRELRELMESRDSASAVSHQLLQTTKQLQDKEREMRSLVESRDNASLVSRRHQAELKEVQNAFLHTKARHDNLLLANKELTAEVERWRSQATSQSSKATEARHDYSTRIAQLEEEASRASRTVDDVVAERNRLMKLNGSISRELEKARATAHLELQKLQTENEHLIQDKQDLEQQLTSLAEQLQVVRDAEHQVEMEKRQKELEGKVAEKDEEINKLKEEVASLKFRIRKLAKSS
eukprot:GHVS01106802.1.p1 GENE.GHVS01106802.1~~GHVS01106802.1.p1  ORF type:complete len:713 (-),score=153.08 GHVS01106802.1:88-2226(-)